MRFLYTLTILIYGLAIRLAALFNRKAARWIDGRKQIFTHLADFKRSNPGPILWFHCASLGEFEQGRPLIERMKSTYPEHRILLTFFSPSGYEIRKNYSLADHVAYLPLDTPWNAKKFVRIIHPKMAFFIKYEYWYNMLSVLNRDGIPVFLISAIFRPQQVFFTWYGSWFRNQLRTITCLFVQNAASLKLLEQFGIKNAMLCGDTRFDRVKAIADHPQPFPVIQQFIAGHPVLMAGSTWPEDEELLIRLIEKRPAGLRFVIAPHEVYQERIQSLISKIGQPVKTYSSLTSSRDSTSDILVIDTIGMLSHLYQYATLVYIGGGFGKGIHNILEAAAFGKSLLFGPNHHRFQEAIDLIRSGGAFPISSADELIQQVGDLISDPLKYQASAEASGTYVQTHTGAADLILHNIQSIKKIS